MAKLPFIRTQFLENIRANAKNYLKYFDNSDNSWLEGVLKQSPFGETKFDQPKFELFMPESYQFSPRTDIENVHEVYEKLKWLTDSQASDERLWAGLCLGPFWDYVHYRWKIDSPESIKQHYLFAYNPRRSLTRNAVSRLWWIGRLTYDSSRKDPYELTDFVCENSRFIVDVLERNVSNSKPLMCEFLGACVDAKNSGLKMDTNTIRELEKYLDLLGGVFILDYMPRGFVYNKILNKANELRHNQDAATEKKQIPKMTSVTEKSTVFAVDPSLAAPKNKTGLVTQKSIIYATDQLGHNYILNLKKYHYYTKPESLIGKKVGDTFFTSTQQLTITAIK